MAGNHRASAATRLGWTEIDAFLFDGDDLHSQLVEIDENLQRAELTAAQRSAAIKRRKEIWGLLHPSELLPDSGINSRSKGRPVEFATDTARSTGENPKRIREHLSRAEALGDDINDVVGTSLDKGVELDALKIMPEPERKELIQRAKAGEQVSARGPKVAPASQPEAAKKAGVERKAAGPADSGLAYMSGQAVRDLVALVDRVVDQAMGLRNHSVQQVAEAAGKSVPDELRPYFSALANRLDDAGNA